MKTKLLTALILGLILHSNLSAADDDASNPCGILLCLLGGQTSGECAKYYKFYIYELPKKCKSNPICQKDYLLKCNTNSSDTAMEVSDSKDINNFISTVSTAAGEQCTSEALNARVQGILNGKVVDSWRTTGWYRQNPSHYRTSQKLNTTCQAHLNSKFSNLSITNTCSGKFYAAQDWSNGYEKQLISKAVYDTLNASDRGTYNSTKLLYDEKAYYKLPQNERGKINYSQPDENGYTYIVSYEQIITNYYKKAYIKKDCWIVQNKE